MVHSMSEDQLVKQSLHSAKTIAMIGISSVKKENASNVVRRPSIIVMNYLQEFGYRVIPINPFSVGKKINGETILEKLEDIKENIDIVNVFRPSSETPVIAKQAVKIGAKVLWLQYGIQNKEAEQIVRSSNIAYIANKCIKQEYQRLFLKVSPVFPVLK
tara:strand:+ start:167 stop:643 length:477 start_codon:yes stop_codon:yes gene_type:complete